MFKQVQHSREIDITENDLYAAKDKLRTAGVLSPDDLQTLDTRDYTPTTANITRKSTIR